MFNTLQHVCHWSPVQHVIYIQFRHVRSCMPASTITIVSLILIRNSRMLAALVLYTTSLTKPQKSCNGVISLDLGGQGIGPSWPIQ